MGVGQGQMDAGRGRLGAGRARRLVIVVGLDAAACGGNDPVAANPDAGDGTTRSEIAPTDAAKPCPAACAAVPDAMAFVPGASVAMGCVPATGPACEADAQPLHVVALSPFLIDRYEVAVAQWKACADAGPCKAPQLTGAGCLYGAANKGLNAMNCITHTDAATYCKALGKRLPSEAEWELAARGGSGASNLPAEVRMARRGQLGADKASVWVGVRCVQEAK